MFTKLSSEKISSMVHHARLKEQKRIPAWLIAEKRSVDDCHAIEKAESERAEEIELAYFYNEQINLPQFF